MSLGDHAQKSSAIYTSLGGRTMHRVNANEFEEILGAHITSHVIFICRKDFTNGNASLLGLGEYFRDRRAYIEMIEEDRAIRLLY